VKWLIIFLVWLNFSYCQIINIPDANFKYLLVHSSTNNSTAYDCAIGSYYKIDSNNDGEIEISEALEVCGLGLISSNINDLTGIEKFTNLTQLGCSGNNLTSIDLSQLTHLEGLGCWQNQLTSLDLSNLPNLKTLSCLNNQITLLDFTNNPMLQNVFCNNNQLSSLDFSNNPLFNQLDCINNPNLTTIKINNGTMQLFGPQTYYNQCWIGLPSLTTICADDNEIPALQSYLAGCGVNTSGITITRNCDLGVGGYEVGSVNVYPNPASDNVNINFNSNNNFNSSVNIKTVELIDVQGRILLSKKVNDNQTTLDVSGYSSGVYYVKVYTDKGIMFDKMIKK
jgi:Leucine-rich repeat (LRR) protein